MRAPVPGSAAWLEERKGYLGGSDLADIAGVGFGDPFAVYLEKIGEGEPRRTTRRMRMGQLLEDAGARAYAEVRTEGEGHQVKLRRFHRALRHPRYDFLGGNPDRSIVGEPGLVEVKATMADDQYGDPGTSEVPARVNVQGQWYMRLTGRQFVDVALVRGTAGVEIYPLPTDQALGEALEELGIEFWTEHIEKRIPPELDGSSGARDYLRRRYPRETGEVTVATPEQLLQIRELRRVIDQIKALEDRKEAIETSLIEAIGDRAGIVGTGVQITYLTAAGRVAWKKVATELGALLPDVAFGAAVGKHTGPAERRWHANWNWKGTRHLELQRAAS